MDVPALVELKLDGKATKLEQLQLLAPWYSPPQPATNPQLGITPDHPAATEQPNAAASNSADAAAAASRSAGKSSNQPGKTGKAAAGSKKPRSFKVLDFSVKAAAVMVGQDPPVLPAQLLEWAMQVSSVKFKPRAELALCGGVYTCVLAC